MWRSLSLIVRSFTRAKGFAVAAVLTVALGIGVNTVVFSLFDRVLFRPPPYREPDRLVQLESTRTGFRQLPALPTLFVQAFAREPHLFSGIAWSPGEAWFGPKPVTPVAGDNPILWLMPVTTNTLDVLGVRPVIGPGFSAVHATKLDHPVLLTYETWQRQYGGSKDVLSREWTAREWLGFESDLTVRPSDVHWRVVGVLPEGFVLPSSGPTRYDGIYGVDPELDRSVSFRMVQAAPFARLAPGVSIAAARNRVNTLAAGLPHPRGETPYSGVTVRSLQSGLSVMVRPYVWLAVVGAWAVLGVAGLTLAILLLTWSQSRRREAGVRLALGAPPRQLVARAIGESICLCGMGAIVGWIAYAWARPFFVRVLPVCLQSFVTERVDGHVIAMTAGIALVTAIAAATLPALRLARIAPIDILRPSRDAALLDRLEGGPVLLATQAAIGVMLLVGALATVPGVIRFLLTPPGFNATDLFTGHFPTSGNADASNAREQVRRGRVVSEAARGLPGVVAVALSRTDPFEPPETDHLYSRWLAPAGFGGRVVAVDANFFNVLGTPIVAGRAFSAADIDQQSPVAILNETAARVFWPNQSIESVLGRTVTTRQGRPHAVVGVAADMHMTLDLAPDPAIFLPLSADEAYFPWSEWNSFQVLVRAAPGRIPDGTLFSDRLRRQSWAVPNTFAATFESVATDLESAREKPRVLAAIFGALAAITLVLTTIAIYGLASFEIRRRREEMTVRLALGATPQALRRRLAAVIALPVAIGVLAGLPLSWMEVKVVSLSVPIVHAGDVRIYLAAVAAIVVAALAAAWLPGRRFLTMRVAELLRSS
jgi:predicted permease